MNERYVRFDRRQDNANQIISADDVNALQRVSEASQKELFKGQDRDFLDRALFVLEHHRTLNGLWVDLFENTTKIDLAKTSGLVFSEAEQAIVFPDGSTDADGYLYSETYVNPNSSLMKKVMVIADYDVPEGTDIIISVSNNGVDFFEPPLGNSEPFEIPTDGQKLKLRARFTRTVFDKTPRLNSWAVLFRDPELEVIKMPDGTRIIIGDPNNQDPNDQPLSIKHSQLLEIGPDDHHPQEHSHDGTDGSGLVSHKHLLDIGEDDHHPKDHQHGQDGVSPVNLDTDVIGTLSAEHLSHQVWLGRPGTTGLYFDPKIGDRLVYVKTPDDETYLFYDFSNDGRLDHTITIMRGVASWETLVYGPYTNAQGQTEIKFLGTEKEMFDATDQMILDEIAKITAPAPPEGVNVLDTGAGGTLVVSWLKNKEFDVVGYNVYISVNGGMTWTRHNNTGYISDLTYTVTGLVDGNTYYFKVTAVDNTGYESLDSAVVFGVPTLIDTIAPDAPTGLNAVGGGGSIMLSWAANTEPDLAKYNVYRSPSGLTGSFLKIATLDASTTTYTDSGGIATGSVYYYYVTAVDTNGNESVPSGAVNAIA